VDINSVLNVNKTKQVSVFGPGNFMGVYYLPVRPKLTRAEHLRELEKEVMLLALPANMSVY